jgi:hypothetical protein
MTVDGSPLVLHGDKYSSVTIALWLSLSLSLSPPHCQLLNYVSTMFSLTCEFPLVNLANLSPFEKKKGACVPNRCWLCWPKCVISKTNQSNYNSAVLLRSPAMDMPATMGVRILAAAGWYANKSNRTIGLPNTKDKANGHNLSSHQVRELDGYLHICMLKKRDTEF